MKLRPLLPCVCCVHACEVLEIETQLDQRPYAGVVLFASYALDLQLNVIFKITLQHQEALASSCLI